jgi:Fic family protein
MTYIHERPEWPGLHWDENRLAQPLAALRHKQGRHLGRMEALGFDLRSEASVTALTNEVVKSSAIEGERLSTDEVRSSVARQLGIEVAGLPRPSREVDGVVEMMIDATRNCAAPLTSDRLFAWHAALCPTGRSGMYAITVGAWRDGEAGPMQVVSGPLGNERVHYQAPDARLVPGEMDRFLDWWSRTDGLDPVLRAAVAHFWFVTIHPFDDGNGRIGRAIADMALARGDGTPDRFYSLSAQIEAERNQYYSELEIAQRSSCDITGWVAWFMGCLDRCVHAADGLLHAVLRKAAVWRLANIEGVNERQRLVLNRMLEPDWQGHLTNAKYAKLAKCSPDSALRDIKDLVGRGILLINPGGGRSTSYRTPDLGTDGALCVDQ